MPALPRCAILQGIDKKTQPIVHSCTDTTNRQRKNLHRMRNTAQALNISQAVKPISIGRLFGIPIYLNWSWFVIFILHVWAVSALRLPIVAPGYRLWQYWLIGILMTTLLLGSVLVHELSHSVMAKAEGVGITNITLHIFGGVSRLERESPTPLSDFRIAIAGPASSFLIGVLFYLTRSIVGSLTHSDLLIDALGYIGMVNLALAAFNLLPGFPLDGGRVLRAYLWKRNGDYTSATLAACKSGRNIALILMFTGIVFGVRSGSYITILYSVFVGVFLLDVAASTKRQVNLLIADQRVGQVMIPASEIPPDLLLSEVVARIENRNAATRYPVTVDKRLHGILTLEQVREIPPERWPQMRARDVMRPVDNGLFINQKSTIPQASALIKKNGLGFLAVIDNDGFVVGVISESDLKTTKR